MRYVRKGPQGNGGKTGGETGGNTGGKTTGGEQPQGEEGGSGIAV